MNDQQKAVLTLMQLKGISRKTIINSILITKETECSVYGIAEALEAARSSGKKIREYSEEDISKALNDAEIIMDNCRKLNIKILSFLEEDYPLLLKLSDDPPALIYFKGDLSYVNSMDAVAVIGTREPSVSGAQAAYRLGESFADRGFVDVSGLAVGCDTEGHKGCLKAGGRTIAVLANGLDSIYPAVNKQLANEIVDKGGALLSEYPPYATVFKGAFVDRDRIQAALSCGVIVIETREKGGTLHAVRYSGSYDRLVGCFKHAEMDRDIEQASGNRMLVNEGKAIYVGDGDLDEFCKKLQEKGRMLRMPRDDSSGENIKYVQMSLFDTIK